MSPSAWELAGVKYSIQCFSHYNAKLIFRYYTQLSPMRLWRPSHGGIITTFLTGGNVDVTFQNTIIMTPKYRLGYR
jgi:hypothetical protein